MSTMVIVTGVVSFGLVIYLFIALLKPEILG